MSARAVLAEVTVSNFHEEVLESDQPVVVEFWANWCRSSDAMAGLLQSLAEENQGALKVARVNVEWNETLTDRYWVRAVPTLLVFKSGEVREQVVGLTTELDLRKKLQPFL